MVFKSRRSKMRKATTQYGNPVTVLSWRQLPNGWEVWQLEDADPDGIFYSYVEGNESEFGLSSLKELESVITLCAEGDELDGLDPPAGWIWEKEISEFEQFALDIE
jgi:hypothetical protein